MSDVVGIILSIMLGAVFVFFCFDMLHREKKGKKK